MKDFSHQLFVGFAAEDRYTIAEPIVYHLRNYGINTWYDRHGLLMGDNRKIKNLEDGVCKSEYACIVISKYSSASTCAMEEFSIIKDLYKNKKITVFPVLFELPPNDIPIELLWVKELVFKEVSINSGTREICNHIVCKITQDLLFNRPYKQLSDALSSPSIFPPITYELLCTYQKVDYFNLNSRISLLYATYLSIINSNESPEQDPPDIVIRIFERIFSETRLNLPVNYRELWLLENALCILINNYFANSDESSI